MRGTAILSLLFCMSWLFLVPFANADAQLDVQSLLAFKRGISHDPYQVLHNWYANSSNACNWIGVTCSFKHPHRVISLQLYNKSLGGIIAPEVSNLSFLHYLNISVNNFTGGIPSSIGHLRRMERLHVAGNSELGGVIPSELGGLYNLRELAAFDNGLTGSIPPSLGNCSKLQKLSFARNKLSGTIPYTLGFLTHLSLLSLTENSLVGDIPISLLNCSVLEGLDLSFNKLSSYIPDHIGSLFHLSYLNLGFNSIRGTIPESIGNNSKLTALILANNHIHGTLPFSLGTLTQLEQFLLYNNSFSGKIPSSLCNATSIFWLEIYLNFLNGIVPLCLGRLPNLESFSIAANNLVDGDNNPHKPLPLLESFYNSSKLTYLDLSSNNFKGTLPALLPHSLMFVDLSNNHLVGSFPRSFGKLTRIITLYLSGNSFEGAIPAKIGMMKSLQALDMSRNRFEGNIPIEFTVLNQSLAYLYLSHNKLSGSIPGFIEGLTSLRKLDLSINSFSGSIPKQLGKCSNLESLDLSSNQLSNEIPQEVASLRNIHVVFNLSRNLLTGRIPAMPLQMGDIVDLSHNKLTGEIASNIAGWLDARVIDLSFNNFSGALPDSFGENLRVLQSIDLSMNNLTGTIPKSLYNLSSLIYLNFSYNNFEGNVTCTGSFRKLSSKSFLHNPMLCGKCLNLTPCEGKARLKHSSAIGKKLTIILASVAIVGLLGSALLFFLLCVQKANKNEVARLMSDNQFMVVSEEEVTRATSNFSPDSLLGEGSHGRVYAGVLSQGDPVAIKIFKDDQQIPEKRSFLKECQTLGRVRHRNLIKIITVCCTDNLKAMIMPLMPKGNLHSLLHEKDTDGNLVPLSLQRRIRIMKEIAAGLSYLHHHCKPPIVHCDVKPENLLLDYDFTVKLSDFGIAKLLGVSDITITSILRGSIGYIAPEFGVGEVTVKGDIYSFGVVVLEVMTRMKPTDPMFTDDISLCSWVAAGLETDEERMQLKSILTSNWGLEMIEDDEWKLVEKIMKVGIACCSLVAKERPNMHEVEGFFATLCEDANYGDRIGPGQTDAILAASIKPIQQATEYDTSSTF